MADGLRPYMLQRVAMITARKRSLGQGNIFAPVCHSVHGGVPGQVHPQAGTPPGAVHAGRYGQQAVPHPTGMHT